MSKISWIKLNIDMFSNPKIKYLRKIPGGSDMILLWVMLLTKAGACNSHGYIMLTENFPYNAEMLSTEFELDLQTVKCALSIFEKLNMINIENEVISIAGWEDHQNLESMDRVRELNKKRARKYRENKKKLLLKEENNVIVTLHHSTDVDKDVDKEVDKDIYIDIKRQRYEELLKKDFNKTEINSLTNYFIKNVVDVDVVEEKLKIILEMDNVRNKSAALITAVRENWEQSKIQTNKKLKFNNFTPREYDYEDLERKLLGWDKDE